MGRFETTLHDLEIAAQRSSSVLVGYSGGKDSIVTMDLCVRTFQKVECYFMYLVPGLDCAEVMFEFARQQWGVKTIHQYPHFTLPGLLKAGCYCPNSYKRDDLADLKLADVYSAVMADTGINMIATGAKKSDSLFRRKSWKQFEKDHIVYPLKDWSTRDVMAYLHMRKLPLPTNNKGHQTSGVDLTARDLLRMYDEFPGDFAKMEKVFPYIRAVVKRREWYGIAA